MRIVLFYIVHQVTVASSMCVASHPGYVRGFGSFVIKKRAKKIGRHIKKNEAIEIPEHYIPSFKPAKIFVDQVKENVTSLPDEK